MMRYLVFLLATIFFLSPLASSHSQAQQEDEITLVIWGDPGGSCINDVENAWSFCEFSRMLDKRWSELHPNIHLVWEDHGWDEALRLELVSAIERDEAPDITIGESFMPGFTRQGLFLPLTSSDEFKANLIPAPVEAVMWDDELYGVAIFTGIFALEVNADVFLASGLDPDMVDLSTWDSVLTAAQQIRENSNGTFYGFSILGPTNWPAAAMFRVAPYLFQVGADFCNMPLCDTPTLNAPNAVAVYEWIRQLNQLAPPDIAFSGDEAYVFSQLFAGISAMQTAGTWHIAWAKESGCVDCRYYALPLPEDGQAANVVVGNAIYSALASTNHPEESQMFLEFIGSDEIQNAVFWTGGVGRLPTTYSAVEAIDDVVGGDFSSLPSFYTEVLGYTLEDAPAEAQKYKPFINELVEGSIGILPSWDAELNALWNEMFAEILMSDKPIIEILDDYQAQAEALMMVE